MLPKDNLIQVLKIFKNFYIFTIILGTLMEIDNLKKLKLPLFSLLELKTRYGWKPSFIKVYYENYIIFIKYYICSHEF